MLKHIVVVSHGPLCEGIIESAKMIAGEIENIHSVQLYPTGDNIQFNKDLTKLMDTLTGDKIIIADLLGGTPCNVSLQNYLGDDSVSILTGLSLPLLLECISERGEDLEETINEAKNSIVDAKEQIKKCMLEDEEDE